MKGSQMKGSQSDNCFSGTLVEKDLLISINFSLKEALNAVNSINLIEEGWCTVHSWKFCILIAEIQTLSLHRVRTTDPEQTLFSKRKFSKVYSLLH